MIDWAFTLSVPAAYDLVCVEANLSWEPWSLAPSTPDRHQLVRDALLEGYRETGQSAVVDQFREYRMAYVLLALLRAMNHLDSMPKMVMSDATAAQVDATAQEYRTVVRELLA